MSRDPLDDGPMWGTCDDLYAGLHGDDAHPTPRVHDPLIKPVLIALAGVLVVVIVAAALWVAGGGLHR